MDNCNLCTLEGEKSICCICLAIIIALCISSCCSEIKFGFDEIKPQVVYIDDGRN